MQTAEQRYAIYKELIGFLPPRIEARINVTGALDPESCSTCRREMRAHAMYPKCFDVKTSQLMLFGMLLMDMNDAAPLHGIAARRAGATWEEMQAVVSLAFLFRGLSAANRGAELLANIAKREVEEAGCQERRQDAPDVHSEIDPWQTSRSSISSTANTSRPSPARRSRTARRSTAAWSAWCPRPARRKSTPRSRPRARRSKVRGRSMDIAKRSELLYAVADEINRRFKDFLDAEVADTGKPHSLASHIDIPRGAANFKIFADVVKNVPTESFQMTTPDGGAAFNYAIRVPKGVIAVVAPVEPAAAAHDVEGRPGARLRQHRRGQAFGRDAVDRDAAGRSDEQGRRAARASTTSCTASAPTRPANS